MRGLGCERSMGRNEYLDGHDEHRNGYQNKWKIGMERVSLLEWLTTTLQITVKAPSHLSLPYLTPISYLARCRVACLRFWPTS